MHNGLSTMGRQTNITPEGGSLSTNEELLTALFTHAPSGLFVIDDQMRIVLFNPSAAEVTGWAGTAPIEIGQHVLEGRACLLLQEGRFDPVELPGPEVLANLQEEIWHEVRLTDAQGKERVMEVGYRPVRRTDGSLQMILGTIRDISTRQRLEQKLMESKKLASLGTLVAGIAHELRNPLGIILSAAEIVANEHRTPLQRKEATKLVLEESRRLDRSIREFLAFARPRPTNPEPTDLVAFCERVIAIRTAHQETPCVELKFHVEGEIPLVAADPDMMRQVLDNLLSNAEQALRDRSEGARVTLRLEAPSSEEALMIVEDNGPGMSSETLAHITDPFFTTKADGTGLGLSIVHQIVEQHGGRMTVDSAPGEGAVFTIHLPLAKEPS